VIAGCATTRVAQPHLALEVEPDPVVLRRVWGDIWEIALRVRLRETGGVGVEIEKVSIRVLMGSSPVYVEELDASALAGMDFATRLDGGGEVQHDFRATRFVPNPRLLENMTATIRVHATTESGRRVEASQEIGFVVPAD
jgi:hypothetical protein